MQLEFEDETLERLAYEADFTPKGWGAEMIRSFRRTIGVLDSARDERDLRNLRGLRYEKLKGNRKGTCSVRMNEQHRIVFRLEGNEPNKVIVILEAVDYH